MISRIMPTDYAYKRGAFRSYSTQNNSVAGGWWLRSSGYYQRNAAGVTDDGASRSIHVDNYMMCIRPALWVNLESDVF